LRYDNCLVPVSNFGEQFLENGRNSNNHTAQLFETWLIASLTILLLSEVKVWFGKCAKGILWKYGVAKVMDEQNFVVWNLLLSHFIYTASISNVIPTLYVYIHANGKIDAFKFKWDPGKGEETFYTPQALLDTGLSKIESAFEWHNHIVVKWLDCGSYLLSRIELNLNTMHHSLISTSLHKGNITILF